MIPLSTRLSFALMMMPLLALALAGCAPAVPPPVDPATEIGTTERQREWERTLSRPLGFLEAPFLKATYIFSDMADSLTGAPKRYALMMEDTNSPDARRRGMLELVERPYGGKPPYTTRYAQIAAERNPDGSKVDYLLRASAIRALNRSREPGHTALFISGLGDESDWVRLESAKALNRLPDPEAITALLAVVARPDENKDIRIAAAEALQHYKRLEVARVLTVLLGDREFALIWQARRSLRRLTGKDYGYDDAAWLQFLSGPESPFN